jgi:hypothetical protein
MENELKDDTVIIVRKRKLSDGLPVYNIEIGNLELNAVSLDDAAKFVDAFKEALFKHTNNSAMAVWA